MEHSAKLEETLLWKEYTEKTKDDTRRGWTKDAYNSACNQLKAVRDTFKNFTLHDETHVLNVLDAMAGLLGNQIKELTAGEAELLILASAFHDLGMVYTDEERNNCLADNDKLREYYSANPDKRGKDIEDWDELDQQHYFRWLHPFRVESVLQQADWKTHFAKCPIDVVPENIIIAVCQAHGESPEVLVQKATPKNGVLRYKGHREIDPLFCSILLRLADILDFDDSRAPSVLFSYAGKSEKSIEEWKKHSESMGFTYHTIPSAKELPYGARFTSPAIERSARIFLDWIDEELSNSRGLLEYSQSHWKDFLFPYQVDRHEIERIGYDFGDFKITMDQNRILELLVGEELYSDSSVFVRELLQNSIDATLTRAEMDQDFAEKLNTDEARIDLWEWWDDKGDLWFRIDDFGTGMTRGMIEKYFLKAGNSYYNSKEFKRDLNGKSFKSISRFGIGFLSCFLCGIEAYVSTKYWNPDKNIREAERDAEMRVDRNDFGLRLDVGGLNEYYTLKNQAIIDNNPSPLPTPPITVPHPEENLENDGYRIFPGTSIAIRIDPGKLGATSLMDAARHWVLYTRMPIYFNGIRLCKTVDEIITLAKEEQGVKEYDLSDEEKKRFDSFLPEFSGNYPKIRESIKVLEANKISGLPNLKIVLLQTEVMVPQIDRIWRKGVGYAFTGKSPVHEPQIFLYGAEKNGGNMIIRFQSKDNRKIYDALSHEDIICTLNYSWKGIATLRVKTYSYTDDACVIILDEDDARPVLKANRDNVTSISVKAIATVIVWLVKSGMAIDASTFRHSDISNVPLKEWKEILTSDFCNWAELSKLSFFTEFMDAFKNSNSIKENLLKEISYLGHCVFFNSEPCDIRWILFAYLQLHYKIYVDYSKNRLIFCKLENSHTDTKFDLFPIMPFCYGNTESDSLILCSSDPNIRIAITADHPFMIWLLENSEKLKECFPRQFYQIIDGLRHLPAKNLIGKITGIVEQLSKTAFRYGIDTSKCPELTMNDFKSFED